MGIWDSLATALQSNGKTGSKAWIEVRRMTALTIANTGNVYVNEGEYPKALDDYLRAMKIDEEMVASGDKDALGFGKFGIARNLGAMAGVYLLEKDYANAIVYYEKALH